MPARDPDVPRFDRDEVKRRLPFLRLLEIEGIRVRKSGPNYVAICPFHSEGSGSFTVHGPKHDHGHCYGCAWNGDIFDFWRERHGGGFVDALAACASLATVSPSPRGRGFSSSLKKQASHLPPTTGPATDVTRVSDAPRGNRQKPSLPPMRGLKEEEIEALARVRGLKPSAISIAAHCKRIGFCMWPQFEDRDGCWRRPCARHFLGCRMNRPDCVPVPQFPSWVITDNERRVAQFRRLDGEKYERKDGKAIKAWTKGSPTWPIGAAEIGDRVGVLLCEGGPDGLAAIHFLEQFRRLDQVAVCMMLGASNSIVEDALPFFARKRVRIPMHVDARDPKTGKVASHEAAARWTRQLTAVGAAVECFSLEGINQKDGKPVEDLNDLVKASEDEWLDPELKALFFDFDF